MEGILSPRAERAKQRLSEQLKFLKDAGLRTRYLIVIHRLEVSPMNAVSAVGAPLQSTIARLR